MPFGQLNNLLLIPTIALLVACYELICGNTATKTLFKLESVSIQTRTLASYQRDIRILEKLIIFAAGLYILYFLKITKMKIEHIFFVF